MSSRLESREATVADTIETAASQLLGIAHGIRDGAVSIDTNLEQRKRAIQTAKQVLAAVQQPADSFVDLMVQMAEILAIRLFIKWKVFENMPASEPITYADLAAKVGAEEGLISRRPFLLQLDPLFAHDRCSSLCMGPGVHGSVEAGRQGYGGSHAQVYRLR